MPATSKPVVVKSKTLFKLILATEHEQQRIGLQGTVMGNLLCPLVLLLLISALNSNSVLATTAGILNFTQSSEAVTPQGNITFRCEATGDEVEWRINGETKFSSYGEFIIGTPVDSLHWTLTLTVQATIHNNGTNVSCFASNSEITNQYVIQTKTFIIAGPPLRPHLTLQVRHNGTMLSISWDDPFTFPGFKMTGYTIQILNMTDMTTRYQDVGLNHTYDEDVQDVAVKCNNLVFIVTAFNEMGNATGEVSGGFPIVPEPVAIHTVVLYQPNGMPHLEIWFTSAQSCSYQEDHYTIDVVNTKGVILQPAHYSDYPRSRENSSIHRYYLDSGLREGANYTVAVIASSVAGSAKSRQGIDIVPLKTFTSCNAHGGSNCTVVYEVVLGLLATIILTLFILLVTFTCLCCKQRKALKERLKSETLAGCQLSTPSQKPTSLQTKCAATNPIYDGPLYESPTGEPLRSLFGSTPSTPNTPLADSPRYFDMPPPSLPPPRKSSVASITPCLVQDTLCNAGGVHSAEMDSSLSGAFDFPSVEDEYTVMRPTRSVRKCKPSPLVIPGLAVKNNT